MSLSRDDIAALEAALAAHGLVELHLTGPGTALHLARPTSWPSAPPPSVATIKAPGFGVFLSRHPLRTEPLALPGQHVRAGQVVALLRIGSLLCQVTAPEDGVVGPSLAEDGALTGFGTPLLTFHPDAPET